VTLGPLLFHEVYDGALGATNSIVVDRVGTDTAIFIAGSMGTRKFESRW
jgi:hypothetical protein